MREWLRLSLKPNERSASCRWRSFSTLRLLLQLLKLPKMSTLTASKPDSIRVCAYILRQSLHGARGKLAKREWERGCRIVEWLSGTSGFSENHFRTLALNQHSSISSAFKHYPSTSNTLRTEDHLSIQKTTRKDDKVSGFHFDLLVNAIDKSGKRKRSPTFTFISTFDKDWNTYQILEKPLTVPEHTGTPWSP